MVDLKQSDFKIFKVGEHLPTGYVYDPHFIVKRFRSTWWSFGKRWFTERYNFCDDHYSIITFRTFEDAQKYIARKINGDPMGIVVEEIKQ
jgi:hypothetical protein